MLKIWMCFLIHLSSLQCSEESTNLPWMWIWLNIPVNLVGHIILYLINILDQEIMDKNEFGSFSIMDPSRSQEKRKQKTKRRSQQAPILSVQNIHLSKRRPMFYTNYL